MGRYFYPPHRKLGVVALAMACILTVAWVRSLSIKDDLFVKDFLGQSCFFVNEFGTFELSWCKARLPLPSTLWTRQVLSQDVKPRHALPFARISPEVLIGPDKGTIGDGLVIQHWVLVIPLTIVSFYLLLSKASTVDGHSSTTERQASMCAGCS